MRVYEIIVIVLVVAIMLFGIFYSKFNTANEVSRKPIELKYTHGYWEDEYRDPKWYVKYHIVYDSGQERDVWKVVDQTEYYKAALQMYKEGTLNEPVS